MKEALGLFVAALLVWAGITWLSISPEYSSYRRSEGVRQCYDGTNVGYDPKMRRYTFRTPGGTIGWLAQGITPDRFCEGLAR
jgi:hypothetical protein